MNSLSFEILPSANSNDHQVRVLIDGQDWLEDDNLGIDPPEFFAQDALTNGGELLVGRCGCGCVGCDDLTLEVIRKGPAIVWTVREGIFYMFPAKDYDLLIEASKHDFSWENANRTTERLVSEIFKGSSVNHYNFDWASTRIGRGIVTLSFSRDGIQKTFDFGWDEVTPESAIQNAKRFYKEQVEQDAAANP